MLNDANCVGDFEWDCVKIGGHLKVDLNFKYFLRAAVIYVLAGFSISSRAEALLLTDIVASTVVDYNVSLMVKVTDRAPVSNTFGEEISAFLRPPGICTSRASDGISRNTPCYVVHIWENGVPIPIVKERVLDNIGVSGWVVLSYKSPQSRISRSIRIEMGGNSFYNDNSSQLYDLRVTGRWDFDPDKPYRFLYSQADRDLNILYRNKLRMLEAKGLASDVKKLKAEEGGWVINKEGDCGKVEDEEGYRCQWHRTLWRIDELVPRKSEES